MIESAENRQYKMIGKLLKQAKYRRQENAFVVEGFKMTGEALLHGKVQTLYLSVHLLENWQEKLFQTVGEKREKLAKILDATKVEYIVDKLFQKLSDTVTPQGILAVVNMPEYERETLLADKKASLLCLEDIQDPGNIGTILRTAEGAGMTGVVLTRQCVDLFNPKVVRSTMGALFRVPFYVCDDMTTEVEHLKNEGFTTYAAHLDGTVSYTEAAYQGKVAVLIGNEANGLREETARKADCLVSIPMDGELESLNAAVSAALFMYEVRRKRG